MQAMLQSTPTAKSHPRIGSSIGAPERFARPLRSPTGWTRPFVMADGPNCYVTYSLEGGP